LLTRFRQVYISVFQTKTVTYVTT